jgi:hypothetical protein
MSDTQSGQPSNVAVTPVQPRTQQEIDVFQEYGDQDLRLMIEAATATLRSRGLIHASLPPLPPTVVQSSCPPDIWDNAKVEQIICSGLKPLYDGTPEKLIPTMNLIHIR